MKKPYNILSMPGRLFRYLLPLSNVILLFIFILLSRGAFTQTAPCEPAVNYARWGIDAGLYSGIIEHGSGVETSPPYSNDWFQGANGIGVIDESNTGALMALLQGPGNPSYIARQKHNIVSVIGGQILIDAIYARDHFGGTGATDPTSFTQASKNGEDPALWHPGPANVLGKNDIVDVGGGMYRDGTSLNDNLWFIGLFNMAEPGGLAYMDFEFYVQPIFLNSAGNKFTSGGPQLGHTAYTFNSAGDITKVGDFIFSVSLLSGGPVVETRLWVSYQDWTTITPTKFDWAGTFDGAYNGAPYGYANIKPKPLAPQEYCGYVNMVGQTPLAPPWGTKNTKSHVWGTTYQEESLAEVGINLTAYGMDHSSLSGVDTCFFPLNSFIVKTRASASFTAQLKDFAGPFNWGQPNVVAEVDDTPLSCDNPLATVTAIPPRVDVTYNWSTIDGNIVQQVLGEPWKILVDKAGTYNVEMILPTTCPTQTASATVVYDPAKPLFTGPPTFTINAIACHGNDGSVTVTASGATQPYTFFLYDNTTNTLITQVTKAVAENSHTFSGLSAGDYRVDVKGVYACIVTTGSFNIAAGIPLTVSEALTDVDCFGVKSGVIILGLSGGKDPLTYLWSTGNTSQNLLNIGAGTYTVTITDADGCETIETYTINQPTLLTGPITKTDDPGNAGDGEAEVFPSGGTGAYLYLWSKTGNPAFVFTPNSTDKKVTGLSYGEYTVVVTDANSCSQTFTVFIFEKEICDDGIDNNGNGLVDCDDPECVVVHPTVITPSDLVPCVDEQVSYTAAAPSGANYDSFVWTVPANADVVDVNGDPMNIADVTSDILYLLWRTTSGGQICVRGKKFDCLSTPRCITVIVEDVPPTPGDIILDNN